MQEGTVIRSTGLWYQVQLEDLSQVQCRIIGKFRLDGLKLTNPVAVGDRVRFEPDAEKGKGIIREILPRRNYVVRASPRQKHNLHLLASNVDQAVVVVTVVQPKLKQGFIDRFLLMTEPYDIPTHIVFNKSDLYDEEDLEVYEYLQAVYESIGYKTYLVSALGGEGVEEFAAVLKDKISLIAGQSGVGKSTLVNSFQPQLDLRTQELSDYSGKGQHTTTFAEMHNLSFGGAIIDTPGIKTLAFNHFEPMDVAHNFRELFILSKDCKFGGNCLHRTEPKCAVKAALEDGRISELRYSNYISLLDDIESQNYWERNKGY